MKTVLTPEKIRRRYTFEVERFNERKISISIIPKGVQLKYRKTFILQFDCYLRSYSLFTGRAKPWMDRRDFLELLKASLPDEIQAACIAAALAYGQRNTA